MEEIKVPFLCKTQALSLGAIFDRNTRKWLIPDEISKENADKLKCLGQNPKEQEDTDSSGHTYMRQQYYDWDGTNENVPSEPKNDISIDVQNEEISPEVSYESPNKLSSLRAAELIYEKGMPDNAEDRIKLLRFLGQKTKSNYPITYEGMLNCEAFAEYYPESKLTSLCVGKFTGARKISDEIEALDASEEDKAFLHFALPL